MSSTSAVFVGDGSLLVRCAQAWREAGNDVVLVTSHNEEIARWAEAEGHRFVQLDVDAPIDLPDLAFDYLFSVANLQLLSPGLVKRARQCAINFHDGPLPRYAGLNAPACMARPRRRSGPPPVNCARSVTTCRWALRLPTPGCAFKRRGDRTALHRSQVNW